MKLLAPNGKPSNLNPEQYRLVRTPAFKAWFGDWENSPETSSKVVDSNGEPLVVYHGIKPNIYEFNVFDIYNEGVFFAEREYVAKRYSSNYNETEFGKIKLVFLNIRKPEFIKSVKYKYDGYSGADANLKKRSEKMKEKYPEFKNTPFRYKDLVREQSEKKGYDGFILENHSWGEYIDNAKQYAVFYPEQIKLADGTNTTFDSNNPDIRYDDGGSIEEIKNYLKNIRVDKDYMESDLSIVQYQSDFGRKGTLVWRAYPEWGKDGLSEDVKGSIYISSISRGTGGDIYSFVSSIEGKKDSRGEGAMALASLFLRYPLVHSVHYEDESGFEDELGYYKISFWQKIGGDESELMREDFFNYFTKKFGYNPDTKTQHLLERYKLLEELAEEIKEKPKNLSYYKRLVALKEKRKKYIESINPDIKFKNGGLTIKKPKAKLLAPNGKPSNLTPEQYRLVRTPAFKEWFGDWENDAENSSKVVDFNGEPLPVFHGTTKKFNVFDREYAYYQNWYGLGFYFTDRIEDIKSNYTSKGYDLKQKIKVLSKIKNIDKNKIKKDLIEGDYLISVFLDIKKPINIFNKIGKDNSKKIFDIEPILKKKFGYDVYGFLNYIQTRIGGYEVPFEKSFSKYTYWEFENILRNLLIEKENQNITGEVIRAIYEILGFDGIIMNPYHIFNNLEKGTMNVDEKTNHYISFNPTQIKLSDGTNTTFDSNNPDIRYKNGGLTMKKTKAKKKDRKGGTIVYRGEPKEKYKNIKNYIWVTEDYDFAKLYGKVKSYIIPNSLNILQAGLSTWDELCDEFDIDEVESMYEPTQEFIDFLKSKGYDGFINEENILIFDRKNIQEIFESGGELTLTSEQVEQKLGRKLHWWNDDVVTINGTEYKKVFLKPEYKRL